MLTRILYIGPYPEIREIVVGLGVRPPLQTAPVLPPEPSRTPEFELFQLLEQIVPLQRAAHVGKQDEKKDEEEKSGFLARERTIRLCLPGRVHRHFTPSVIRIGPIFISFM